MPTPVFPTANIVVPPTIVTGTDPAPVTPIEGGGTPELPTQTAFAPPTSTPPSPTALPPIAPIPQTLPDDPHTRAFALTSIGGLISGGDFLLPFAVTTFARDPQDASRYALVDTRGLIYLFSGGFNRENGIRVRISPFSDFEPDQDIHNNARVRQIAWSPDGRYLAFVVDTLSDGVGDNDSANDGVWFLDLTSGVGRTYQLIHDCPPEPGCLLVAPGGEPQQMHSQQIAWNPNSNALLVSVTLPQEGGRRAFTIVKPIADPTYASTRQKTFRYDYASWSWDGSRVLASGGGEDGRVGLRWVDPATGQRSAVPRQRRGRLMAAKRRPATGRTDRRARLGARREQPDAPVRRRRRAAHRADRR